MLTREIVEEDWQSAGRNRRKCSNGDEANTHVADGRRVPLDMIDVDKKAFDLLKEG